MSFLRPLARQASRLQLLQHRAYATVPAEVQKFDWDMFEDVVTTDEGRRDLERLKSTFRELENQAKQTKQAEKVNFDRFQGLDGEVLQAFKAAQAGKSLKIPKYDFSVDQKEIDELFDPLIQQADEMAQQATKRLGEIKNELKALDAERERISRSTIDEELAADPEMAKRVDKEITEANYMII